MVARRRLPRNGNGIANHRPSGYRPEFAVQARAITARLGATDVDLAELFNVSVRTIYRWAGQYDDFCQALKVGKGEFDNRVVRSLAQRAVGYSYESEKIFCTKVARTEYDEDGEVTAKTEEIVVTRVPYVEHVPPDVTAEIYWTKNRLPKDWRDKQEHLHDLIDLSRFSDDELAVLRRIVEQRDRDQALVEIGPRSGGASPLPASQRITHRSRTIEPD